MCMPGFQASSSAILTPPFPEKKTWHSQHAAKPLFTVPFRWSYHKNTKSKSRDTVTSNEGCHGRTHATSRAVLHIGPW